MTEQSYYTIETFVRGTTMKLASWKAICDSVDTAHDANVVVAKLPRGTEYRVTRHVLTTVLRGVKE